MKISIVTATFNSGATLSDTLRSLLVQTHTDFELIVADGGSTDNTADIIREFAPDSASASAGSANPTADSTTP